MLPDAACTTRNHYCRIGIRSQNRRSDPGGRSGRGRGQQGTLPSPAGFGRASVDRGRSTSRSRSGTVAVGDRAPLSAQYRIISIGEIDLDPELVAHHGDQLLAATGCGSGPRPSGRRSSRSATSRHSCTLIPADAPPTWPGYASSAATPGGQAGGAQDARLNADGAQRVLQVAVGGRCPGGLGLHSDQKMGVVAAQSLTQVMTASLVIP